MHPTPPFYQGDDIPELPDKYLGTRGSIVPIVHWCSGVFGTSCLAPTGRELQSIPIDDVRRLALEVEDSKQSLLDLGFVVTTLL